VDGSGLVEGWGSGAGWGTGQDLEAAGISSAAPVEERILLGTAGWRSTSPSNWAWAPQGKSCLVIGPSGSGKTTAVVIPTLMAWGSSALVTSTKPDVIDVTWRARRRVGPLYIFDPMHLVNTQQRAHWSPLSDCGTWDEARRVASALLAPQAPRQGGDTTIWVSLASQLLAPLLYAARLGGRSMGDVCEWIQGSLDPAFAILETQASDEVALRMLGSIGKKAPGEYSGATTHAMDAVEVFTSSAAREASLPAAGNDIDFEPDTFLQQPSTLYIVAPQEDQRQLAPFITALVESVIAHARRTAFRSGGRLPRRLLLALDEVANIAPLPGLAGLASDGAQQGMTTLAVLQDLSQAYRRWGQEDSRTIFNNFPARLLLPGQADPETLRYFHTALGTVKRVKTSEAESRGYQATTTSTSTSLEAEPLATEAELRMMPGHCAVLMYGGLAPAMLRQLPHFATAPFAYQRWGYPPNSAKCVPTAPCDYAESGIRQMVDPITQAGETVRNICDWYLPDHGVSRTMVLTDHSLWQFAFGGDPLAVIGVARHSLTQLADVEIIAPDVEHESQTLAFLWQLGLPPSLLASSHREAPQFAADLRNAITRGPQYPPQLLADILRGSIGTGPYPLLALCDFGCTAFGTYPAEGVITIALAQNGLTGLSIGAVVEPPGYALPIQWLWLLNLDEVIRVEPVGPGTGVEIQLRNGRVWTGRGAAAHTFATALTQLLQRHPRGRGRAR
jgi:type IV secretion system protein VirD4